MRRSHNVGSFGALFLVFAVLSTCGCLGRRTPPQKTESLAAVRRGFRTATLLPASTREPVEIAPPNVFRTVQYASPVGPLAAYVSPDPGDGRRHPAILWITGGDCNTIGDVWSPASPDNDQTAAAYRKAGIVMLFPSLRGGNTNPGSKEGFLGEVDDVLAAAAFLEKQRYVDPKRIYLGGHSTGGTLALLAAESSARFRGTFSFGPIDDISGYGTDSGFIPTDLSNRREVELRSPGYWLSSIRTPVWVIEGSGGNIGALRAMQRATKNPNVHFVAIDGADHFETLAPTNALIAGKIVRDTGATSTLTLTEAEVNQTFGAR